MGIESSARILFGWEAPSDYYESPAFDVKECEVVAGYEFLGAEKAALEYLGVHMAYSFDEWSPVLAHKGFLLLCRGLDVKPLEVPSQSALARMSAELKRDAATLGLDLESLGEPRLLVTSSETWQEEDEDLRA